MHLCLIIISNRCIMPFPVPDTYLYCISINLRTSSYHIRVIDVRSYKKDSNRIYFSQPSIHARRSTPVHPTALPHTHTFQCSSYIPVERCGFDVESGSEISLKSADFTSEKHMRFRPGIKKKHRTNLILFHVSFL